jgi:hypothetical protein
MSIRDRFDEPWERSMDVKIYFAAALGAAVFASAFYGAYHILRHYKLLEDEATIGWIQVGVSALFLVVLLLLGWLAKE